MVPPHGFQHGRFHMFLTELLAAMKPDERNLLLLNPKFLLRFSENRQIRNFIDRHFTVDLGLFLCLFDHKTESILRHTSILVKGLPNAFVGSRRQFFIDLHPLHHNLNRTLTILENIAVRFDTRFDNSFDLIRPFLDLPHGCDQTTHRVTEKFVGPREDNKAHLLSEEITWWAAQCGSSQPLVHEGKPPLRHSCGKKFYLLVRVKAKMIEY